MFTCIARILFIAGLVAVARPADAEGLQVLAVAPDIYALVGPLGQRDVANAGDNATFGAIVTSEGVILIDSGATPKGAAMIRQALRGVTDKPVRWVINTGSQDHRWLGNASFAAAGARIVALACTVHEQQEQVGGEVQALRTLLNAAAGDVQPLSSPDPLPGDTAILNLGGVRLELHHFGDGHFPGDAVVWLPAQRIAFTGDLVFVDRLLGVLSTGSRVDHWAQSFRTFASTLHPDVIVPGHGRPCDLPKAQAQTGDYLDWLVREVQPAARNLDPLEDTVRRVHAAAPAVFQGLENFETIDPGNINRSYLEFQ